MRLTQLKLAGFKSFVDPTVIPVPSQLVGVVGPNGCGKSNIIDAVRWVLGEAKASELRGESMQDVIFNGSGKPAARASVEMVFDNSEGRAAGQWSTYAEIAVRRVLTRDGTSSYFVNNQQVRRRDIHDIFLGTGLGARGYAIIGQGMINRLIEARPEELRVFLEEAAGVSRYKERRRETENRLSDTRENLTRVEDILRELNSQLESWRRRPKSPRATASCRPTAKKQHSLWFLKETGAREERARKAQEMLQAQNELEAAIAGLRAGEAELESRRQAHYAASDAVHSAQGQLYEANAQVSRLEAEIRHVVDSRNRLQAREQLQQQIAEWNTQREHCTEQIAQAEDDWPPALPAPKRRAPPPRTPRRRCPTSSSACAKPPAAETRCAPRWRASSRTWPWWRSRSATPTARCRRWNSAVSACSRNCASCIVRIRRAWNSWPATARQARTSSRKPRASWPSWKPACPRPTPSAAARQGDAQTEVQSLARLEARLSALVKLQEDVQKQGALEPWLAKHELAGLQRLWQKLHVEPGWETRWNRPCANAWPRWKCAAWTGPAPSPKTRRPRAWPSINCRSRPRAGSARRLTPLASLLRITDPDLRTLLNEWLAGSIPRPIWPRR